MAALDLGTPEDFPFLDPPDTRLLNDGYRLLIELAAVDGERRITRLGRRMAQLPVDPRLARVLVESGRVGCVAEALVIASFLSIADPRERPAERAEAADERHAQFADARSDFVAILNLWAAVEQQSKAGPRPLRRWCRQNFLSWPRIREWLDLHEQLAGRCATLELRATGRVAAPGTLHQAILSGFIGGIGVLDEDRTYLGARDLRFVIAPGTPLQKRPPRWIVAASLVETRRLYARTVAQVQPSWIESAAAHLVRRTYGEAQWDAARGMVMARETVALHGRVLSSGRQVNFAAIDPALARRMFVEEALVRGGMARGFGFLERNAAARARVEALEARLRRRDLLAADDVLVEFYLERIPADVASTRAFDRWWLAEERRHPGRLDWPESLLVAGVVPPYRAEDYPDSLDVEGNALRLAYRFDPASDDDGVTLEVPAPLLGVLPASRLDWLIPGYLAEKVVAVLRGLPKDLRRELVPIPAAAARFVAALDGFGQGDFFDRLATLVTAATGARIAGGVLATIPVPPWLRMNLAIVDDAGRELGRGRDLDGLRRALRARAPVTAAAGLAADGNRWSREGIRHWDFGDLPEQVTVQLGRVALRMYPGLEDDGAATRLRLHPDARAARDATRGGLVRLAAFALPQQHDLVRRRWSGDREFVLLLAAAGFGREVPGEVADRALAEVLELDSRGLPRSAEAFAARLETARGELAERGDAVGRQVRAVLVGLRELRNALGGLDGAPFAAGRSSIERQLGALFAPGWVRRTPADAFGQLPKYVQAAARRAARLRNDVERDRRLAAQVEPYERAWQSLVAAAGPGRPDEDAERLRWLIEEFRLSLFAQDLRTLAPVSAQRLDALLPK
jgi:ATP-dependent helicase HrpA